jgi:hypothetical protein
MASLVRDEPVDSIDVGDFSCQMVVPPYGVVYFQPEQIDSDTVVFSRLEFCHVDWPIYLSSFVKDSSPTVSNGWATSTMRLHCDTTIVVSLDSCSLFINCRHLPPKDTMMYYLNKIYNHDFTVDTGWRGTAPPPLCHYAGYAVYFSKYSPSDSTFIRLNFSRRFPFACSGATIYSFVELNGGLSFLGASYIIP